MLRKTACAAGGVALACAAAYSLSVMAQDPPDLDLHWLYGSSAKADRLPVTRTTARTDVVVSFDLPAQNTTIVARGAVGSSVHSAVQMPPTRVRTVPIHPVREVPNEEEAKKERLPEGCEPAFSPVTTPAFAHISVRCDS